MCGITGFISKSNKEIQFDDLLNANQHITHRGPDSEGYFYKSNNGNSETTFQKPLDIKNSISVGLGFKRLSILDVQNGQQPFESDDGRFLAVFNGEIYNYKELKKEVKGYNFKSTSDGEVIIPLFEKYGIDFVKKLRGMFAICIFDNLNNQLTLIRDQVGIKPVYYYENDSFFFFSSEIKSLLQYSDVNKKINHNSVYDYLTFQNIFGNETLFSGINLVDSGSVIQISRTSRKEFKFWDYSDNDLKNNYSKFDLKELISNAVHRHLVSDVSLGSYLSSGLDTSTITTFAKHFKQDTSAITCGYENTDDNPRFGVNESEMAKTTAKHLEVPHHIYKLKTSNISDTLFQTIFHLDEPRMGYSYQNLIISKATSDHYKVVLSGVGSDEIFGGYPWRYNFLKDKKVDFDSHFNLWNRVINTSNANKAFIQNSVFTNNYGPRESYSNLMNLSKQSSALSTIFAFEFNTFLKGLLIVEDKLSMANSLESRVPFLDLDLVEYVIGIDPKLKFKENEGKLLLKDSVKDILPKNVLKNPKVGFIPPISEWRESKNRNFILELLSRENLKKSELLDFQFVQNILDGFFSGDNSNARVIWSLLSFQAWFDIYFSEDFNFETFYNFDYNNLYTKENI